MGKKQTGGEEEKNLDADRMGEGWKERREEGGQRESERRRDCRRGHIPGGVTQMKQGRGRPQGVKVTDRKS